MSKKVLGRKEKEATAALSIGTFLEYFDLLLFVHMAVLLDNLFFSEEYKNNPYILAAAFCSTYILRPLGAFIFGWIGDNIGRKNTVVISTTVMALSCVLMANMPTYAQIGISATWLVTICRIIQGMTSMGERIGAEIYLTESSLYHFRFPIVSLVAAFATLGGVAALGFANCIIKWGFNWRYVFWFGAVIALVGIYTRMQLHETAEFVNYKKLQKRILEENFATKEQIDNVFSKPIFQHKASKWTQACFFFIQCAHPVCFYFIYGYCTSVLKLKFACTPEEIIHNNFIVSLFELTKMILIIPILSYYIYPLKILYVKLTLFFVGILAVPYFLSIATSAHDVFLIQAVFASIAVGSGPALPIFYSHFPVMVRSTNAAVIYALARMVMYVITAFGAVGLTNNFGYLGLLILFLPIFSFYLCGLVHFTKLEKARGLYPESWFNLHITHPVEDEEIK